VHVNSLYHQGRIKSNLYFSACFSLYPNQFLQATWEDNGAEVNAGVLVTS